MWERKAPRSEKRAAPSWTWTHLRGGGVITGHLAGPTEWIVVHWIRRSIPCYSDVTNKRLACPHCRPGVRTSDLGYVPVYRDDGRPIVVGIPAYNADGLRGVEPGMPVKVYRGKDRGDPIRVVREKGGTTVTIGDRGERPLADIRPWLLTLWREQPLIDFFAADKVTDDDIVIRRANETRRAAEEAARELPAVVARRITVRPDRAADGDTGPAALGDVLDRVQGPHRNGPAKPR